LVTEYEIPKRKTGGLCRFRVWRPAPASAVLTRKTAFLLILPSLA